MDLQITRNPASIIVLAEASEATANMLQEQWSLANPIGEGIEKRDACTHMVIRGNEEHSLLIGVRTDVAKGMKMKYFEVNDDHRYRRDNSDKMARPRLMVCEMEFKQNIGHIGNYVRVCGVHGHNMTMTKQWPIVWHAFWDRLAHVYRSHGVHFLAGDFNMSLTEVLVQLGQRNINCDCIAWYPWEHKT